MTPQEEEAEYLENQAKQIQAAQANIGVAQAQQQQQAIAMR